MQFEWIGTIPTKYQPLLRAVKDWVLFCPCTPLIKTVMRLFTAVSNYSQLWLCYDSHEKVMQLLLGASISHGISIQTGKQHNSKS